MQLKKMLVSLLAVAVSTAAFALPRPSDDEPTADLLQQYSAQIEEMNKTFDSTILPSVKGLASVIRELESTQAEELTEAQETTVNNYMTQLTDALKGMAKPMADEIDINEYNQQMKKVMGDQAPEFTKDDLVDQLMGMYLLVALQHFADAKLMSEEDLGLVYAIFFPEEEQAAAQQ